MNKLKEWFFFVMMVVMTTMLMIGCFTSCVTTKKVQNIVANELQKKNYIEVSKQPYSWYGGAHFDFILPHQSLLPTFYNFKIDSNGKIPIDSIIFRGGL